MGGGDHQTNNITASQDKENCNEELEPFKFFYISRLHTGLSNRRLYTCYLNLLHPRSSQIRANT